MKKTAFSFDIHALKLKFVLVDLVAILERPVINFSNMKHKILPYMRSWSRYLAGIFPAKPITGTGINNDTFWFTTMLWSKVRTSLFLFNREFFLSSIQYKETFAFLWQGKAFPSITNIMANDQRRKICSLQNCTMCQTTRSCI